MNTFASATLPVQPWHWPHLGLLAALPGAAVAAFVWHWPPTLALFGWLQLNVIVLALAERWRPFRTDWNPAGRHLRRDGSVWTLNLLVDGVVTAGINAMAIAWLPGSNDWPLLLQILVGLLAGEFGSYWLHRWSQRDGWFWRVHLLHHRPDRLNLANAVTAHPINAAYDKAARLLPLLWLGLSPEAMLSISLFTLTQVLVTHANVAGRIGLLNWFIGSAELHRLHHSTREQEAGNFGTALPLWDQVFGTYRAGAPPHAVGVFDPRAYPGEFELRRLLAWPFTSARRSSSGRWACCAWR
jgi:sterol desaturase/sphingolipid hydroxylase (fatty acid hydroxylase superfamily)